MKILLLILIFGLSALAETSVLDSYQWCRINVITKYPDVEPPVVIFATSEQMALEDELKSCEQVKFKPQAKFKNNSFSAQSWWR